MWRLLLIVIASITLVMASSPKTGDDLISNVLEKCVEMNCVKKNVLNYLDNILKIKGDSSRNAKNLDAAIFKRVAKLAKTHEFRMKLPQMLFDESELVYNPQSGLDITSSSTESRGLLKKKLLLPVLLLLKLKMKALLPIFVALIGLKSLKALILSKLAIAIVLGFVIYQFVAKSGMPMPMMSMMPTTPPDTMYGAPIASTPSSYEPGWEPNQGGPYSRIWSTDNKQEAQNYAYSAYYPGPSSSSTLRP